MSAPTLALPVNAGLTIFVLSLGNFMVGIAAFVVLGLMTTITNSLGVEPADGARLITYYSIAYALGSPLLVASTGNWPRRTVATLSMFLVGIGSLGCAFAPTLGMMEIARVVTAFGGGLFTPSTSAVAVSLVDPERRGWALSRVFIGFTAAQGIGNPIGAWLGYTFSWQVAFLVVGLMALAMTVLLWRLVPAAIPFRPTSLDELARILLTPHMLVPLLFTVFYVAASYTMLTYLTLILETRLHLTGTGVSISLAIYGGMAFVAAVISGWLTDTFTPTRILFTLCVLMAILLPLITQGPEQVVPLITILAAWSLSSWSHFTAQQSRLVSINPAYAQLLLALNSSMLYVGIAGGSMIAAKTLPIPEFKGLAVSAVVLVAIAAVVLWIGDRMITRHRAATSE